MGRSVTLTFRTSAEKAKALAAMSAARKLSRSELLREAVFRYLRSEKRMLRMHTTTNAKDQRK